jgi:hypothetical protein
MELILRIIGNFSVFVSGFTLVMLAAVLLYYAAKNPDDKDLNPSGTYMGLFIIFNTIIMLLYFAALI